MKKIVSIVLFLIGGSVNGAVCNLGMLLPQALPAVSAAALGLTGKFRLASNYHTFACCDNQLKKSNLKEQRVKSYEQISEVMSYSESFNKVIDLFSEVLWCDLQYLRLLLAEAEKRGVNGNQQLLNIANLIIQVEEYRYDLDEIAVETFPRMKEILNALGQEIYRY